MAHQTPSLTTNLSTTQSIRPVTGVNSIVGIVFSDANADANFFPENELVLISNYRTAIEKAGENSDFSKMLKDFALISAPSLVVCRAPATAEIPATDEDVVASLEKFINCQQKFGFAPDCIGAPGLESTLVCNKLEYLVDVLDAPAYFKVPANSVTAATTFINGLNGSGKSKPIFPDWVGYNGRAAVIALALRALISGTASKEYGPHQGIGNIPVPLVSDLTQEITWSINGLSGDVKILNLAGITSMVKFDGAWRYWGDEMRGGVNGQIFENVLTMDLHAKKIITALELKNISKTLTKSHVKNILAEAEAQYRVWKSKEWIAGFRVEFREDENSTETLASGQWVVTLTHSVPRAGSKGVLNIESSTEFLAGFAKSLIE